MKPEKTDIEKLAEREFALATYSGEYEVLPASTLREMEQLKKRPSVVMKSGLPTLDKAISGFEPPELTVFTGMTKGGKTTLARGLTAEFIRQGFDCLWLPYENCGEHGTRFMSGFGEHVPEFVMPKKLKRNALDWLDERIWEAQLKYANVRAVFIDHLHFLFDMARTRNPSLEIGAIMRRLVGIAQERNVAMFLIAHMNKVAFTKEPEAGDLRDSSFIEQEADNVFAIWRNRKPGSNESKLKVIHNRRMGVMDLIVPLQKVGPYLRELEQRREEARESWENRY